MLEMKIETLVAAIVRQELRGKGREGEALYFHFDLGMGYYTDDQSYKARKGLHLLYYLTPDSGSYITVFSAVTDSPFTKIGEIKKWKHECTHDTCWRDIGVFSQVYFAMAEEINAMLKQDGLEEVAPKDMSEHNSFPIFNDLAYSWKKVRVSKDPNCESSYRKMVEVNA